MRISPDDRKLVLRWLTQLDELVREADKGSPSTDALRDYADLLLAKLPAAAFTTDSRAEVAGRFVFFPAYAELLAALTEWWNDNKPKAAPVIQEPEDGLTAEDRQWIAFWHKRRSELFAQQTGFKWGSRERDLENLASLIRQQSARAWRVISGVEERGRPTPEQREQILDDFHKRRAAPEPDEMW